MMAHAITLTIVACAVVTTTHVAVALIPQPAIMTLQPSLTMARARPTMSVVCVAATTALAAVVH